MPEFTALTELIAWIAAGGGAAILAGRVLALVLEDMAWWHTLSPLVKKWIVRLVSLIFAIGAEALLQVDLSVVFGSYAPLVGTVVLAIWNWLASQNKYISIKETTYGDKARSPSFDG